MRFFYNFTHNDNSLSLFVGHRKRWGIKPSKTNCHWQVHFVLNQNTIIKRQYNNLNEHFEQRVEDEVEKRSKVVKKENKKLKEELALKIDRIQRLEKQIDDDEQKIIDKNVEIESLKNTIKELEKKLEETSNKKEKVEGILNNDGTNSGTPTSQTPLNKKKLVPNSRKETDRNIGGQRGHKRHKLNKFKDEEVNAEEQVVPDKCPHCGSKKIVATGKDITKDLLDYYMYLLKKRFHFLEYECQNCSKKFHSKIPDKLKEENQYGNQVQAHALSLTNMANVPFNKTRRIISGLKSNEINLSEGFISKLQKRASDLLQEFMKDLNDYVVSMPLIHWDDTVIFVNTKRECLRFYGDDQIALYTAHEHKSKDSLIEDNVLTRLTSDTKVVHDHNKVNYNEIFVQVNVECCEHLERDLEKVSQVIKESTWSAKLKDLFSSYNTKRKEYLENGINSFSFEETNDFMIKFDEYILLGIEENKKHGKHYYFKNERTLITRLTEYRDNYTYWLFDFDIPYTNNTAERGLRGVKTKLKVSGQFKNIEHAKYYANIRSYIETCHRNGINEIEALTKLLDGKPFTIKEILEHAKNEKL